MEAKFERLLLKYNHLKDIVIIQQVNFRHLKDEVLKLFRMLELFKLANIKDLWELYCDLTIMVNDLYGESTKCLEETMKELNTIE